MNDTTTLQIPEAAEVALALGNTREAIRLTLVADLRRMAAIENVEYKKWVGYANQSVPGSPADRDNSRIADMHFAAQRVLERRADELDGDVL